MDNELLNKYIDGLVQQDDQLLYKLERDTYLKTLAPQMISGKSQGKLLEILSKIVRPSSILEIGTFTGYSTLCLAKGLTEDGIIITIDPNEEVTYIAQEYFSKSEFKSQIQLINGYAKEIIPTLDQSFDFVFLDADKESYIEYFDLVIDKLCTGGLILADNILWSGKVWESKKDKKAAALDKFNRYVADSDLVDSIILPIRDGIHLLRKR